VTGDDRRGLGQTRAVTVEQWERRSEVPLTLLALAFLGAYAWPVLDPGLGRGLVEFCLVVSWSVWAAFAVDLLVRLLLATERRRYAVDHWYDVALVVLPVLRPLRLLRLLALVRMLDRSAAGSFAGRVLVYVAGATAACVGLGALAVLDAEGGADGANIETFGDAIWWACSTVSTVGYGDYYPVTTAGRCVAVVLMVVGIGLLGAITAAVASFILERAAADRRAGATSTDADDAESP